MKLCSGIFLLICFVACTNEPKGKGPVHPEKEAMPAATLDLLKKVSQNPDSAGLRFQLVDALDSLGYYTQALIQVDSLIRKDSLNYGLWYRKALVQENIKDTTGALRSYKYAIRVYPSPDAMLGAANLLAEQKNDTALLLCKQVAGFRMGREYTAHCYFITGVYYARKGEKDKAMDAFNACIYNNLNYMEAYMEKGFLYYYDKKINEALKIFQTVVTLKNTYADGYYWLAKCYETGNNQPEAIVNYRKSLTLDPTIKEAKVALKRLGVN